MLKISDAKVGLPVLVEINGSLVSGVIMVIDPESGEFGIKEAFTSDTKRFPAEKVHIQYPRPNGHQLGFSPPTTTSSPRDKALLRLLGGFIITIAGGKPGQEIVREVAEEIKRKGISKEGARAQELIAALR